ncbi:glycogen synthase GlgA [Aquibacillus halophilus]|uniref:Glycogen synthase n=1 Tax=Aquibacillus halophilus TaxID=930132 RepID=A0A6A8DCV5_9BACI|nr:glycogen synthase GlgA [Aquibacillus halophilus]MRH43498.1 glycogen synthase GlgA [Aquibacillus halophilus]
MGKKILFVASECSPFVKTGGLADVVGSLPQVLNKNEKTDVRVILPLYQEIIEKWMDQMELVTSVLVPVGWRTQEANIYQLTHNGTHYYFIGNDYYFARRGVYGYYDDGERFVFFCHAVIEALPVLDFKPDILHAHDWQAGLAVAFAKISEPVKNMKTVFTIHNIKYQGIIPRDAFEELFNIPLEHVGGLEWNGLLNCMKSGIFHADKITTVSPTYAEEIKTPYYGEGLHSIFADRQNDLIGIINGIDLDEYNPMTDPHISSNYKYSRIKKKENKEILQERLGLPVDSDKPLYVMITRLVEQKGLHLVQSILDEFLQEDIQFVLLGTGDYEFENYCYHAEERNKGKLVSYLGFDEGLARQIYAASDFFVMPSLFEPCGLSQLIALQYKAVPIVRETGGLKDTVTPFDEVNLTGNGFSFANYNAHELLYALRYSLETYHDPDKWAALIKNVNKSNFSWNESAREYANLYQSLDESLHNA